MEDSKTEEINELKERIKKLQETQDRLVQLQELAKYQKMESIGSLSSNITHDMNNIIAIILNSLMVIEAKAKKDKLYEEIKIHITAIRKAGQRGAQLSRKLLQIAKDNRQEPKVINLKNSIDEISIMFKEIKPKNITFTSDLSESVKFIHADESQIFQMLLNLLVNAKDALESCGKEEKTITVQLSDLTADECPKIEFLDQSKQYIKLTVSDNGMGISQSILSDIFTPFFTTKPT
ncbi:MAG: hypothetical protein KDD50_11280, partial [Bdellovibrionales bacterium]|nr:hypothetical protein [Bdellovibrionales bacterium]